VVATLRSARAGREVRIVLQPPEQRLRVDQDSRAGPHIHQRSRARSECAGGTHRRGAAGFDTALCAVLKTLPGQALSEGPRIGPKSKPEGRTIARFMNGQG
jgi:hypothetical protein